MIRLCKLSDVADPGAYGARIGRGAEAAYFIVVCKDGQVKGYVNSCPHWGTPLEIVPGNFLSRDKQHLFCATHGAKFRISDGFCVDGPCEGASLIAVALQVEGDTVSLAEDKDLETARRGYPKPSERYMAE